MRRPTSESVPAPVVPESIRGGSHGITASYAAIRGLAAWYDSVGDTMRGQSRLGARTLAHPELLESAILAPRTFACAEAAIVLATTGPDGILVQSVRWEADALALRATVTAFETTDELVRATFQRLDYAVGRSLGFTLTASLVTGAVSAPTWLPPLALVAGAAYSLYAVLPPRLQDEIRRGVADDTVTRDLEQWWTDHPEVFEHLADGSGGLVDGFWDGLTPGLPFGPFGVPMFTPGADDAGLVVAGFFPEEGRPEVTPRDDLATPGAGSPPDSLAAVIGHLDTVNSWSGFDAPQNNGTIEIQSWTGADGVRHHIVYLPGTDDLDTVPWSMDGDVRDLPTSLLAMGGHGTAYAHGILESMHRAGIGAADPVVLAGHSQGGIEAAWIAGHTDEFTISQVITAGSPIAELGGYPSDTHVLSLEHRGDVVPLVDGADNPDAVNQVTITFDDSGSSSDVVGQDLGSLSERHLLSHYVNGAAGVDRSDDPSVTSQLARLHGQGFLTGQGFDVETRAFQITRSR